MLTLMLMGGVHVRIVRSEGGGGGRWVTLFALLF